MIQILVKNKKILKLLYDIPFCKYFFVAKITSFIDMDDQEVRDMSYRLLYPTSNITKQTENNRFSEIDAIALKYMKYFNHAVIHDVAVSSGITSLNLYDLLGKSGFNFSLFVSDKYSKVLFYEDNLVTKVYDMDKNILFCYLGPFLVTDKIKYFWLSKIIFSLLEDDEPPSKFNGEILLYENRLIKLIKSKHIQEIEYDILSGGVTERFTYIRCMNLLNLNYFSNGEIALALEYLRASLVESGVLQIGRTMKNGENHVSFYQKHNNKLVWLEDVRNGTEIKDIIQSENSF